MRAYIFGFLLLCAVLSPAQPAPAQTSSPQAKLSAHWEELTGADFIDAIKRSQGACILPFGILEKHGPHLPLGTDLLDVRYASLHAAEQDMPWSFRSITLGKFSKRVMSPVPSPIAAICS